MAFGFLHFMLKEHIICKKPTGYLLLLVKYTCLVTEYRQTDGWKAYRFSNLALFGNGA